MPGIVPDGTCRSGKRPCGTGIHRRTVDGMDKSYDAVVIGGGAAGLSGALMLGRARRAVLVIDSGAPRNAPAEGVHGLLGRDGIRPAAYLAEGRADVQRYGGEIASGEVTAVRRDGDGFSVELADGSAVRARRILVASGLVDQLPDLPGLREQWGRGVVHCPYCHGYEVRDRAIAVLATSPMAEHQAQLWRQWSPDITLLTNGFEFGAEQLAGLRARGVTVVDGAVTGVRSDGDRLTGVVLADGSTVPCEVLVAASPMKARADFLAPLGIEPADHPMGAGEFVPADPTGRAAVPGVWLAGNVSDLMAQVGSAAAAGAWAAAQLNMDLVTEEVEQAKAAAAAI
jgi:thioredoxin reductase